MAAVSTGVQFFQRLYGLPKDPAALPDAFAALAWQCPVFRIEPAASPLGIGLTIASLVIMAALWRWRLALADRLGSPALRGDAACSMVCLYMGGVALVGLLLN